MPIGILVTIDKKPVQYVIDGGSLRHGRGHPPALVCEPHREAHLPPVHGGAALRQRPCRVAKAHLQHSRAPTLASSGTSGASSASPCWKRGPSTSTARASQPRGVDSDRTQPPIVCSSVGRRAAELGRGANVLLLARDGRGHVARDRPPARQAPRQAVRRRRQAQPRGPLQGADAQDAGAALVRQRLHRQDPSAGLCRRRTPTSRWSRCTFRRRPGCSAPPPQLAQGVRTGGLPAGVPCLTV